MEFSEYQREAQKTDRVSGRDDKAMLVPLLGLAGEVGTLLTEYKKYLRDGGAHQRFRDQVAEDLGDLLWYIANTATKFELDLDRVADGNLKKTRRRWLTGDGEGPGTLFRDDPIHLLDEDSPASEQIPRKFTAEFSESTGDGSTRVVLFVGGRQVGDPLTDNAHSDDGYRYHDVFHLSYAAVLGWSPIIRKLLNVKRKSRPDLDEVEDGARARIIEELISQLVFAYAREHLFLDGVNSVDYHLLKTIQSLVSDREVRYRSLAEWEQAIVQGYEVWRAVRQHSGGRVEVDLCRRQMTYLGPSESDRMRGRATTSLR